MLALSQWMMYSLNIFIGFNFKNKSKSQLFNLIKTFLKILNEFKLLYTLNTVDFIKKDQLIFK